MLINGRYQILPPFIDAMKVETYLARKLVKPELLPADDWETETELVSNGEDVVGCLTDQFCIYNGIVLGIQVKRSCMKNAHFKMIIKINHILMNVVASIQQRCRAFGIEFLYKQRFFIRKFGDNLVFRWVFINQSIEAECHFTDCIQLMDINNLKIKYPFCNISKIKSIEKSIDILNYYVRNFSKHRFLF